jgi:tRNA nucleotidyltransferase (CCA-adding enzyme)
MGSKGTGKPEDLEVFAAIRQILEEIRREDSCLCLKDLAVKGNDLMALGCRGKTVGTLLNLLLEQVVDEQLPNEKQALLLWAQNKIKENTL